MFCSTSFTDPDLHYHDRCWIKAKAKIERYLGGNLSKPASKALLAEIDALSLHPEWVSLSLPPRPPPL